MLKIRRSHDRLIFNMGIPTPGKDGLYNETWPWSPSGAQERQSTMTYFIATCFLEEWSLLPCRVEHFVMGFTHSSCMGIMMTSSNGNLFRVTGHLCGKFTSHRWIPRTKSSNAEFWCFLVSAWMNGWVNNREIGDLRRQHAHYDVTIMIDTRVMYFLILALPELCLSENPAKYEICLWMTKCGYFLPRNSKCAHVAAGVVGSYCIQLKLSSTFSLNTGAWYAALMW